MCGICGIYHYGVSQPVDRTVLKRMTDVLSHRGPDDDGQYLRENIGLGHRRLSIIDLAAGHQPMSNEDDSIWIVFNGEIYNFQELHQRLLSKGHQFKTKSDTEAIIHLYEELGEDCVHELRGMFAFAIWDEKRRKLVLARDRLGIKPLHYFVDGQRCFFGSEIKAILENPQVPRTVDLTAVDDFLTYLYIPAPKTIFKGIKKLLPGHLLVCTPEGVSQRPYWDVRFSDTSESGSEPRLQAEQQTKELLAQVEDAVGCRLISEVPLGAFLSGGIDSSFVVGMMTRLLGHSVTTSSIGFHEQAYNELGYAKTVAEHFDTNHHEHVVTPQASEVFRKLVWHFDEPFADASAIPTYYVSQTARQHVTVALSGDGGDEMLAGYRRYYYDRLEDRCRQLIPGPFRRHVIGTIARLYPKADWLPQPLRAKTLLTNIAMSSEQGCLNSRSQMSASARNALYTDDFRHALHGYDSFCALEPYFQQAGTQDPLSRVQYVDMKSYLVDDILTKVDRMSMAHSLEVRVPLLDHHLVEYAGTIQPDLKLKGKQSKYILKQAAQELLPDSIIYRNKQGFVVPMVDWLKNDLKPMATDLLFDGRMISRGYFRSDKVKSMWKQHQRGLKNHAYPLWCLLNLELWHRIFVDGNDVHTP